MVEDVLRDGRTVRRAAILALAIGVFAAAYPSEARGQAGARRALSSPDSARLAADLFFRAVADERWEVAASMVDTVMIRQMIGDYLRRPQERAQHQLTIDDFMRDDPKKPLVVAEYELKRYREQVATFDVGNILSHDFAGVTSVDDLRALTTREATARYLKAKDMRFQFRERIRKSGCASDSTALQSSFPFTLHRILAAALAGDTVAYVLHDDGVFSTPREGRFPFEPMVMQLRLRGDHWVVIPSAMLLSRSGMSFGMVSCDSSQRRR